VDGIEWKRDKYNKIEKLILYLSEIFAVHLSDVIIADSVEIKKYIELKHRKNAVYIAYGVDKPQIELWNPSKLIEVPVSNNFTNLENNSYYLVVSRLEPENNIHVIVEGFLLSSTTKKLVIVGNFLSQKYELSIKRIIAELNGHDRIIFTKGIYKKDLLNMLRQNCFVYIHGHSAGGTNPSLLEAMVMKDIIVAHDNEFNREVGSKSILYFKRSFDLSSCIENIENNYSAYLRFKSDAYERVLTHYSWEDVAIKYNLLFKKGYSGSITENHEQPNDSPISPQKAKMPIFSNLSNKSPSPSENEGGDL
jgi:rhamnosyltransferase